MNAMDYSCSPRCFQNRYLATTNRNQLRIMYMLVYNSYRLIILNVQEHSHYGYAPAFLRMFVTNCPYGSLLVDKEVGMWRTLIRYTLNIFQKYINLC